jgi:Fe-S oxidoreductase
VFRDEAHNLFPESEQVRRLIENTFTLSEFLTKKLPGYEPPRLQRDAIVQGHCHHKAIMRFKEEKSVMERMGLDHEILESGCCGMAGAFGYEEDKYQVSVACGERALLPAVRKAGLSTLVIADGFSCKEQISQQTSRHALHLAQVLQMGLRSERQEAPLMLPERYFVKRRKEAEKKSMIRAGIVTLAVLGLAATGLVWANRGRRRIPR